MSVRRERFDAFRSRLFKTETTIFAAARSPCTWSNEGSRCVPMTPILLDRTRYFFGVAVAAFSLVVACGSSTETIVKDGGAIPIEAGASDAVATDAADSGNVVANDAAIDADAKVVDPLDNEPATSLLGAFHEIGRAGTQVEKNLLISPDGTFKWQEWVCGEGGGGFKGTWTMEGASYVLTPPKDGRFSGDASTLPAVASLVSGVVELALSTRTERFAPQLVCVCDGPPRVCETPTLFP